MPRNMAASCGEREPDALRGRHGAAGVLPCRRPGGAGL
jgi:hypothetical protein